MSKTPALLLLSVFLSVLSIDQVACQMTSLKHIQNDKYYNFYEWASEPPMGWNSWDCFGPTVTESEVKANADYMSDYLKEFGWKYIVVDIRWYVSNDKSGGYNEKDPVYNIDGYGRFVPAPNRFPSSSGGKGFKPLADYIHNKGLKFGIHVMRGVPVIAVNRKLPVIGTRLTADNIFSAAGQCEWLKDMYTADATKNGAQEYYNSVIDLYASWGVDFLKIDDLSSPYHSDEIEMIRKAIDRTGRKIVLSTSPGPTPVEQIEHIRRNANMWRTVGDLWDNWKQVREEFGVLEKWAPYVNKGTWPDGDMLPLGHIGIRAERGKDRMSLLTKDEQYTLMTLFAIFRSPLMFGGNLPDNDEFTKLLITNKEVLNVNQNSRNGRLLYNKDDFSVWIADDPETNDKYIAVFNLSDNKDQAKISLKADDLGIKGTLEISDLWKRVKLGSFTDGFTCSVNSHGVAFYRIH